MSDIDFSFNYGIGVTINDSQMVGHSLKCAQNESSQIVDCGTDGYLGYYNSGSEAFNFTENAPLVCTSGSWFVDGFEVTSSYKIGCFSGRSF